MLTWFRAFSITLLLALFGGDVLGQILDRSCLDETDQGDGLALIVDNIGDLHLSRGVRLSGALLYTKVDVNGVAVSDQIANRITRLPFTQTLATAMTRVGDTLFVCFQDKLGRRMRVASGQAGAWTISTVEDNVQGDGCAIVHDSGVLHVVYENRGALRHARGSGNGSWTRLTADSGAGNDVGALAKATLTDTNVLVVAHRNETDQTLRLARWNGARWSVEVPPSPLGQPGLRPAITATSGGAVKVFHGTGIMDSGQSDGTLLQTEGVPGGDVVTGPLPDFSTGGFTGAAHGERGTYVVTRRFSRSALFGDSDGLLFLTGDPFVSTALEQYGAGDTRHTFKFINVALDPFGLPVIAFVDEFAGRPNNPGGAPVCFWRPRDTDRDRIPDEIEAELGTNPEIADTDGDGRSDGEEVLIDGTDPTADDVCRPSNEACDGDDNDCDGRIDEALARSCYDGPPDTQGIGRCRAGTQTCTAGLWAACSGDVIPQGETCNGLDDDCDGIADEDAAGVGQQCETDRQGVCRAGTRRCIGGALVCLSTTAPTSERCNQADDDCDGRTDEGQQTCGDGVCETTVPLCSGGQNNECTPGPTIGIDALCDGIDEDCDGSLDEAFIPQETECGRGGCARIGTLTCVSGQPVDSCTPGAPADLDVCNGVDDDCDGRFDEDFVGQPTQCGVGACLANAITVCQNGREIDPCTPSQAASTDRTCDGVDDDCNGLVDDGVPVTQTACGQGACATVGTRRCIAGAFVDDCEAEQAQNQDTCDGVDNDCDGRIDEAFTVRVVSCGTGVCVTAGRVECVEGAEVELCEPLEPTGPDGTCNGLDEDCDGRLDEAYVVRATQCGTGACRAEGQTACAQGIEVDECRPGQAEDADDRCDGADTDCDGRIDEGFVGQQVLCGDGACQSSARQQCINGAVVDACQPSQPAEDDVECDGIDADCDGRIDEGFSETPSQCGTGACADVGQRICVNGQLVDTCVPGQPAANDATCNDRDEDCDGRIDEDFSVQPVSCGIGVCQSSGTRTCVSGVVRDECAEGEPQGDDADCDGVDNDCDENIDESFVSAVITCGIGACRSEGATICENGQLVEQCNAGAGGGDDATCDGIDDDCDGRVDERFIGAVIGCGVGACSNESQTICQDGQIIDTCVPGNGAPGPDVCDGTDSDCDGQIDENHVVRPSTCGIGACEQTGRVECVDGREVSNCEPNAPAQNDEICDGVDSDCDRRADEDFENQQVECGLGICRRTGILVCRQGEERQFCSAAQPSGDDRNCDGLDDDCDGVIDEGFDVQATSCGQGVCRAAGQLTCVNGRVVDTCQPEAETPGPDRCDGLDSDCDGRIDEAHVLRPIQCGVGECQRAGVVRCVDGTETEGCQAGQPSDTEDVDCDGLDVDCDGNIDEDFEISVSSCGVGVCAATGLRRCVNGQLLDSCQPADAESRTDSCDGRDEDCDGRVDENHQRTATRCGVGVCSRTGRLECRAGAIIDSCVVGQGTGIDNDCNGTDEDCDGENDEGFVGQATQCGVGACRRAGTQLCRVGRITDTCREGLPAPSDASCDGVDQDCDSRLDEDFDEGPTQCGRGACRRAGRLTCVEGRQIDSCQPGSPAADDAECDGLDTDCDGRIDEAFAPSESLCGTGVCAARGVTACIDGVEASTCTPTDPIGDDSSCDGVDDDCDAKIDEGVVPVRKTCGVGVCRRSGLALCLDGTLTDTCVPDEPEGPDANCDGIDQDCDGRSDEAYLQQVVRCGLGVCEARGVSQCRQGQESEVCVPLRPLGRDVTCDGADDDCDGQLDEAAPEQPIECGEGACQRVGASTCVNGDYQEACEPGQPDDDDAVCDGVDSDCDGVTDEDYAGITLRCGLGECSVEQKTQCVDGGINRQCTPSQPAEKDDDCNGLDDDCDGRVDEDVMVRTIECGAGACRVQGLEICFMAQWFERCTPLEPAEDDQTCDGQDDDCDDIVDEDCREDGGVSMLDMGVDDADAQVVPDAEIPIPDMDTPDAALSSGGAPDGELDGTLEDSRPGDAQGLDAGLGASGGANVLIDGGLEDGGAMPVGGGRSASTRQDGAVVMPILDSGLAPVLGGSAAESGGATPNPPDGAIVDLSDAGRDRNADGGVGGGGVSASSGGGEPQSAGTARPLGGALGSGGGCPEGEDCGTFGGVESGRPVKEACDCSVESSSPVTALWVFLIAFWPYLRRRRLL